MTTRKTPQSLSSYAPELLSLLMHGGNERKDIPLPTWGDAVKVRLRLYQLRKLLQELGHAAYPAASRCRVRIIWGKEAGFEEPQIKRTKSHEARPVDGAPVKLRVEPADHTLVQQIKDAGVDTNLGKALLDPESSSKLPPLDIEAPGVLGKLMGETNDG